MRLSCNVHVPSKTDGMKTRGLSVPLAVVQYRPVFSIDIHAKVMQTTQTVPVQTPPGTESRTAIRRSALRRGNELISGTYLYNSSLHMTRIMLPEIVARK